MMTFEWPSSDNHERIDETVYGSSLPLIKKVDAQAAPVLMSAPNHEVVMWLSLMCTSNRVTELSHWKDIRSRLSVETVSALWLDADVMPRHRRVMQQVVFLDLVLAGFSESR